MLHSSLRIPAKTVIPTLTKNFIRMSTSTSSNPPNNSPTPPVSAVRDKALQKAIQKYLKTLSDEDKAAFLSAPDIIEHLQEMERNGKTLISSTLTTRVEKVLQCVKTFMGSLAIFIQQSPEISSLVVGGVNCILTLVLGYIEFFERLTGMMESIGTHLSYLSEYSKPIFQESEKLQEALCAAYCDLLEFYVKARQVFVTKKGKPSYFQGFKIFFRLTWQPFEAQFGSIEARFSTHTISIVRLANVDYQNRALQYQNQVLEYQKREGTIRQLEEDKKNKKEAYEMQRRILEWLSPDDFEETHDRHFKKRFENTGQWLLDDPRFRDWRDKAQSSLLWCYGAPGSGKTVLASLVIEHLSELYELSTDTGTTFIYCNYQESRTTMTYIRLALKQLCRKIPSIPPKLHEVWERHYRNNSQPKYDELHTIFLAIIPQFGRIFFVLDALDECNLDQRKDLCEFILGLVDTSTGINQGIVKLFVTSRKESDIERAFQQRSIPTIEVKAANVDDDINIYVKAQIKLRLQDGSLRLRNMALKDKILSVLTSKAGGMFLWVEFQLDAICAEISDNGIRKALKRVPEDMDTTYERILDIIKAKPLPQRELARKVLIWTAHARRPLPIHDLAFAISIEMDMKTPEAIKSSIPTEEAILSVCANLVSVDRSKNRYVRFVHFSVQEFLTSHHSSTLRMGYEVGHREIAQACIIFLNLFPKRSDFLGYISGRLHRSPAAKPEPQLQRYALNEWPHHLLAGNLNSLLPDDPIVALTLSFFKSGPGLLTKQPMDLKGLGYGRKKKTCLQFSSSVLMLIFDLPGRGNQTPCKTQLEKKQPKAVYDEDLNCMVLSDDNLAIHYATAELDSVPVAQRLCNHGYSLNYSYTGHEESGKVQDWLQLSPLYSVQSTQMAKYLLDNGISIEPQGLRNTSANPLKYFAQKENRGVRVFQLLLEKVVDRDDGRLNDALQTAAYHGNIEVTRLLLDKGVDVNARGGEYGNALQAAAAAFRGEIEVIRLLLDKGANVNAQGGRYGNVLQAAAFSGEIEVIRLLLDKGSNVNAQGGKYGSALQAAVFSGKKDVIRLLLDKGADFNLQGGVCSNALQAAVYRGKTDIIRLLLDKGADIHVQGGIYGNTLQAAAYRGKKEVISLLLAKGANINTQGGIFGTALQAAAYNGNIEAIRLLLDQGADIHARAGKYGIALKEMLELKSPSADQKVPGDIPLLVELLQDHAAILMEDMSESQCEYIARGLWNKDRCNLHVFRELLESRGWVRGGKKEELGRPETDRESYRNEDEDGSNDGTQNGVEGRNGAGNGTSQEPQEKLLGASNKSGTEAAVLAWKVFGFTFLALLFYTLIEFFWA